MMRVPGVPSITYLSTVLGVPNNSEYGAYRHQSSGRPTPLFILTHFYIRTVVDSGESFQLEFKTNAVYREVTNPTKRIRCSNRSTFIFYEVKFLN
jgi:hypothetical protein